MRTARKPVNTVWIKWQVAKSEKCTTAVVERQINSFGHLRFDFSVAVIYEKLKETRRSRRENISGYARITFVSQNRAQKIAYTNARSARDLSCPQLFIYFLKRRVKQFDWYKHADKIWIWFQYMANQFRLHLNVSKFKDDWAVPEKNSFGDPRARQFYVSFDDESFSKVRCGWKIFVPS